MTIAVNTRLLIANKLSGIGWFSFHTLKRLIKNNPQHRFVFIFDRNFDPQFIFGPNVIPEVVYPPTRHPILQYLWFEYAIPAVIRKHKADIFYSPDGYLSLRLKDTPMLDVIHDINFHHNPKDVPFADRLYFRHFFPKYARTANRILTVSEYSRTDISETYNIPPDKIDVTCNGANDIYFPLTDEEKRKIRNEYTSGSHYFIYIGGQLPRKNIARMLLAFEKYKKVSGSDLKFIIVGDKVCKTADIEAVYRKSEFRDDIIFTGHVPSDKLRFLLCSALALILVSYYEGFGIPVIEAMYADVPVITSNVTSLPEIAGDAAMLVDPYSIDAIADAMGTLEKDSHFRQTLIDKGRIQRSKYTWDKAATAIWQSIELTLSDNNRFNKK